MALHVHSSAVDPQSPFPCTPSTLGGSPPSQYFRTTINHSPGRRLTFSDARSGRTSQLRRAEDVMPTATGSPPEAGEDSSTSASPRTPLSITSPNLTESSCEASPQHSLGSGARRLHQRSPLTERRGLPTYPSSASIPIILAGIGLPPSDSSASFGDMDEPDEKNLQRASVGLGILQETSELGEQGVIHGEFIYRYSQS